MQPDGAGKCFIPLAPSITTQPQSQTNLVGGTVSFSVAATGTSPLSYQWSVNGTTITNATSTILTLTNVQRLPIGQQLFRAPDQHCRLNPNSATATLTVNAPVCDSPPSGLVAWWQAEGDANDIVSGNIGSPTGGYQLCHW